MLTTLTRENFLDRDFGPDELAAAVAMLGGWCLRKRGHALTVRGSASFWGFPRPDSEAVAVRARERAAALGLAPDRVTLSAASGGMLTLAGPDAALTPDRPPTPGDYPAEDLARFAAAPEFDGLCAELRVVFSGPATDHAVVFYGVNRQGRFRMLAAWPLGSGEFAEEIYGHAPWPYESNLIAAVHDFRNGDTEMPSWAQAHLFPNPRGQALGKALVWFLRPGAEGKFAGVLLRVGLAAGVAGTSVYGLSIGPGQIFGLPGLFALLLFVSLFGLGFHLVLNASQVVNCYQRMKAGNRLIYSRAIGFRDVDLPTERPEALRDPALNKLTGDLLALGARHLFDVAHDPPAPGSDAVIRVFTSPDGGTVFTLMLMGKAVKHTIFPFKPVFHLQTTFPDGHRWVSINGGAGFRRPWPGLSVTTRLYEGESDPAAMLRRHEEAIRRSPYGSRRPVPVVPEEVLPQMVADHEQARGAAARYGYFSWGDAFRMVFKITLPEYRD